MRMIMNNVHLKKSFSIFLIVTACLTFSACRADASFHQSAGAIPIQNKGRIKPLDVFARETVRLITGKEKWNKQPAIIFLLDILSASVNIMEIPCVRVDYPQLKEILGIPEEEKYISFNQAQASFDFIMATLESAQQKSKKDIKLSQLDQKVQLLYSRLTMVGDLNLGKVITVIPPAQGNEWKAPSAVQDDLSGRFMGMIGLYAAGSFDEFAKAADQWRSDVSSISGESFEGKIQLEMLYYKVKPFFCSWILYLLAFILLVFFQKITVLRRAGVGLVFAGFVFHTGGLILRWIILSHPPVANMYESMVFMNWTLILCSLLFFMVRKTYFFLTTGTIVGALVMIYAAILPIDSSLGVLAPVLRSSYWLTVHVMTIVASYGIFGLTMAIGHRHLLLDALNKLDKEAEQDSLYVITHLMQAGLIALGAGTILGGVWANESWGRFWGWDPKETWALITFLGYMAVLHLRFAERIKGWGMAVCSVLGFLLVLMTWYGVNFILGKGLHSYGSASGGTKWIVYYLIFEVLFFAFVLLKRRSNKRT